MPPIRLASLGNTPMGGPGPFRASSNPSPDPGAPTMAKSSTFDNDLLKLIFNATPIAGLADNAATSPLASLYVALHTADPTAAGNQSSNEVAYTGYARVAVARTTSGWTVTAGSVSPAAAVNFAASTGGASTTATFWSVGTASSGSGKILYSGAITPSIAIASGAQAPQLTTASAVTES